MNLENLLRKNIASLKPYSSARVEYTGEAMVFLDANENPFNQPYNRYPDPLQKELKEKIAALKDVEADKIFLGNGSDEPIDLLIRAFCEPAIDNIVTILMLALARWRSLSRDSTGSSFLNSADASSWSRRAVSSFALRSTTEVSRLLRRSAAALANVE